MILVGVEIVEIANIRPLPHINGPLRSPTIEYLKPGLTFPMAPGTVSAPDLEDDYHFISRPAPKCPRHRFFMSHFSGGFLSEIGGSAIFCLFPANVFLCYYKTLPTRFSQGLNLFKINACLTSKLGGCARLYGLFTN